MSTTTALAPESALVDSDRRQPFATRRIEVDGVGLNVVVEGQGPDVLLIHGFPDSHQVWRHQIGALVRAGYRVIAPDLRGFGGSDMPAAVGDYRLQRLVADLVGVLDALGVQQARVAGHDWGAVIGWALAVTQPQRVGRYAAVSVGHPNAYSRGGWMQKLKGYYVLLLQLRGPAEWALRAGDWRLLGTLTRYPAELPLWRRDLGRPGRLTAAINLYRANLGMVLPQNLPPAPMPVLGVWSDGDDFLVEHQMLKSRRHVTGPWRYARIEGFNHWIPLEAPDRLNALLLDFFR